MLNASQACSTGTGVRAKMAALAGTAVLSVTTTSLSPPRSAAAM